MAGHGVKRGLDFPRLFALVLIPASSRRRGRFDEMLKPPPEDALQEWIVSPKVNRSGAGDDDPTLTPEPCLPQ
ncbi:hypothetical protein F7D14_10120 [Methylocystis parvus]|uniref:Uncharacterized protein n=1 Tax=Methylocystis parvus TaxID=134 RepID=A0A6B8M5Q8_9HYPH|nr:hypothetical protein F7D14_10120 [Methylocystis parvus]